MQPYFELSLHIISTIQRFYPAFTSPKIPLVPKVLAGIRASEADIARMLDMATAAAEEASMRRYELLAQVPMRSFALRSRVFHGAIEIIGHHPFVN